MVRIDEFMKRTGIRNQTELADRLHVSQGAVSAWNAGVSKPTYDTCLALLRMGMTIEELFGETFPMSATDGPDEEFDRRLKRSLGRLFSGLGMSQ